MKEILLKTKQSVSIRFVLKIIQQILSLIFAIILANILSPEEFGVLAIINMIIYYCNSMSNIGMNSAIIQMDDIIKNDVNSVFTLNFFASIILFSFIFFASENISFFFKIGHAVDAIKVMSVYLIVSVFYNIPSTLLRRNVEYKTISIVELCESILVSLTSIMLALHGHSYWSIIYSTIAWQIIFSILLIWLTKWTPNFCWSGKMSEIVPFGLWTFFRNQLEWIVSKIDYFVIGKFLGVSSLGLYEKSFELTERALSGVSLPINAIFYSTLSRLKYDLIVVKQVYLEAVLILTTICYPILFGIYSVAPLFVTVLLGEKWQGAVEPLEILALAGVFRVLFGLTSSANVALGKHKLHTACVCFCSIFFVILCFAFVKHGIKAIALCFLFYSVISFMLSAIITKINLDVSVLELIKHSFFPFAGSVLMVIIIKLFNNYQYFVSSNIVVLLLSIFIGIVFYGFWIFMCYYFKLVYLDKLNIFNK